MHIVLLLFVYFLILPSLLLQFFKFHFIARRMRVMVRVVGLSVCCQSPACVRLHDSVPPMHVSYCACPIHCNTVCARDWSWDLIMRLVTAQSSALWYKLLYLFITTVWAAWQLPNARLPFSDFNEQSTIPVALQRHESYCMLCSSIPIWLPSS